ncbi:MAG TPA: CHASE3 domain-containing protein [Candidatus Baltobacteraceae bacterium]|nr:CHASE3 domain-containing protein [Candidatus Baltobacteraceae bacterium]
MKTKSLINRRVQVAFGAAILTMVVVGTLSYHALVVSSELEQWVRHTHEVIENLERLMSALQNVQSSFRGMVITGKESYLGSYHANIASTEQYDLTIRRLTVDNPLQQQRLPALEKLAAQLIRFSDGVISLRRTKGMQAAAETIGEGTGQRLMDEFQVGIRDMQDEELRLLAVRSVGARRRMAQAKTALVFSSLMGLFAATFAVWSVRRESSGRALVVEKLRESEEKYRSLIDGVQDYAIFTLDPGGKVISWNAGAERIKGYKAEEIIGQDFSRFYLQTDIDEGKPEKELHLAATSGRSELEHWRVRKDGSRFWANVVLTAARDSSGLLVGFSEISQDISERKKSEEHLIEKVAELKRSNDDLEKFASVASHDLQEPLRMVASFTQLLAKRYKGRLDSDADEFIGYAVDGSNRMQSLIKDLLTYSRAGSNGKILREISSADALKTALTGLQATIVESGAEVTQEGLPALTTDDGQLALVFQNLVGNAIKYRSAEVPRIHVSATKNGGNEWIFSVRDNGMGIEPQYFERIFVLFQRLHGQTEFKGSGIGLAICKKILERLGGRIWVESQLTKGSTFCFALPARDGEG